MGLGVRLIRLGLGLGLRSGVVVIGRAASFSAALAFSAALVASVAAASLALASLAAALAVSVQGEARCTRVSTAASQVCVGPCLRGTLPAWDPAWDTPGFEPCVAYRP